MKQPERIPASLDREVRKEMPYPNFMSYRLVEKWGDGIPCYAENDVKTPEWKETPCIPLDLSKYGYGEVLVKDEGDPESNRTRTIKDRAAWELATLYRDYARALYLKMKAGTLTKEDLKKLKIPRFSLITAGNEGRAIAEIFEKYDLPPPKLIIDKDLQSPQREAIERLKADIYVVDLSAEKLTPKMIREMSNNQNGVDITSVHAFEPNAIFYDWHVHEGMNQKPDQIYVPYGSGRLMENYLTWQARSLRNEFSGQRDPRLRVTASDVIKINVLGAEPEEIDSKADKLTAKFKPFLLFRDQDIEATRLFSFTGRDTSKHRITEERIEEAFDLLNRNDIEAEHSAAAGLALYLDRFEKGLVKKGDRILVVNTGIGLV